jgi:hypothetical protein
MTKVFNRSIKIGGELKTINSISVRVLEYDYQGKVLRATGTSVPTGAGYAKGCIFIKTNAAAATKSVYENQGTTTSASFNLMGDVAASEITLAEGNLLVGNSSGVGVALNAKTSGQILVGNGTTLVSVVMSGDATLASSGAITVANNAITSAKMSEAVMKVVKVTLTNAEIKALRATPKTLVAAPGANKVVQYVSAILKLKAGANVLTETADNLGVKYTNGSGVQVSEDIEVTGFIDQAANTQTNAPAKKDAIVVSSGAENKALVLHNTGDGEYAGNAAADATMEVYITYKVHDVS